MSDSAKLRFVYGIIAYVFSFLDITAIVLLSLLIGFKILHSNFGILIFLLCIGFILLVFTTLLNFEAVYYIGKKEGSLE